ncbi:5594_t:CDS:2, partial [Dentiscutata erythropus]
MGAQNNIDEINTKISAIKDVYENIQYNKRICISLMDRIDFVELFAVTGNLQRNNKMFNDFKSLVQILNRTEIFMKNISHLQSYIIHKDSFEINFNELINEFSAVSQQTQQVNVWNDDGKKSFEQDSEQMNEFIEEIRKNKIIDIDSIAKTIETLKKPIKNQTSDFESFNIAHEKLIDPFIEMANTSCQDIPDVEETVRENFDSLPNLMQDKGLESDAKTLFGDYQNIILGAWQQESCNRLSWAQIYPSITKLKSKVPNGHFIKYNPLINKTNIRERRPSVTEEQNTKYIPFEKLITMEKIDEKTYVAKKAFNLDSSDHVFCKEFDNKYEEFIRELDIMKRLGVHEKNVIEFIGISEANVFITDKENNIYYLIMEYAEEGDLRHYLEKNSSNLKDFKKQLRLALGITKGLMYLHHKKILHGDLHDKNVVISHGDAKIIDFGKSMHANNQNNNTLFGCLPFMAPELFKDLNNIEYTDKSDIYSLGVILWELTSRHEPFRYFKCNPQDLKSKIIKDKLREKNVPGTHDDYLNLYKSCWEDNPSKRPKLQNVYTNLVKISNEIKTKPGTITLINIVLFTKFQADNFFGTSILAYCNSELASEASYNIDCFSHL